MNEETKNINAGAVLDQFINDLTIEAGVAKKLEGSEDVLIQFKKDLKNRLENRINATILSQISKDKLAKFEELLDSNNQEAMQAFCLESIPNFSELIASELINFRSRYIEVTK